MKRLISFMLITGSVALAGLIIFDRPKISKNGETFYINEITSTPVMAKTNATEKIAQDVAKKILEKNPEGPTISDGQQWINAVDPQRLAEELLQKGAKEFDYESLKPSIANGDLNILKSADDAAIRNYFEGFSAIFNEYLDGKVIADIYDLITAYQTAVLKLYKLPAPEQYLDIHKQTIALLSAKAALYEKALGYDEDPVASLIAIQYLDTLHQEISDLQKSLLQLSL